MPELTDAEKKFLSRLKARYQADDGTISRIEQKTLDKVQEAFAKSRGSSTADEVQAVFDGVLATSKAAVDKSEAASEKYQAARDKAEVAQKTALDKLDQKKTALTEQRDGRSWYEWYDKMQDKLALLDVATDRANVLTQDAEPLSKGSQIRNAVREAKQTYREERFEIEAPSVQDMAQKAGLPIKKDGQGR